MKKRWMSLLLTAALLLTVLPLEADAAFYYEYDQRYEVDGSYYTTSTKMAQKLNAIFDGSANIYHDRKCTNAVNVSIGTSNVKNNGVTMYAGPYGGSYKSAGTSCWIYAAGVYYTLFGEVGFQSPGKNSEALDLSKTSSKSLTYANLKAWGVRDGVGAHIRTSSHSMIVLDYDADGLTILDGNNDGRGKVSVRKRSWNYISYTVSYITQPTDAYYYSEYPVYDCQHDYTVAVTKAAGCVEDGVYTYSCTKCPDSFTESIPATGHDYQNDYCTVCGTYDSSILTGTCGVDLNWTLRSGTLTVTGTGEMYDYLYNGAPWYKNSTSIKSVVIDSGVTGIGDNAFASSENLTAVAVGDSVTRIGDFAFQSCQKISALTLGSKVETIGLEAFKYTAIKTLNIPDSTTYIGDLAFGFCQALTQVRFGRGLATIRDSAFYYTPNLKDITFRGSAPSIGEEAFVSAKATARYPSGDASWTSQVMKDYGGTLTWTAYSQGLNMTDGGYYDEGVLQTDYTGLASCDGETFYVEKGYINRDYLGLLLVEDTWYYIAQGRVEQDYTGLAEYQGDWYYVESNDQGCTVNPAQFTGVSVMLDGLLGVTFKAPAGLTVAVNGQTITSDTGTYTVYIMAQDMTGTVHATLTAADGRTLDTASFDLAAYVTAIEEQEQSQATKTLARATLTYCRYAARLKGNYDGQTEALADIDSEAFREHPFTADCDIPGVSISAYLEEACQLRVRLSGEGYTVQINGVAATPTQAGSSWIYSSDRILPQDYDAYYTVTIAKDGATLYTGRFSVLMYLGYCLENGVGTADQQELMKAMYHYYVAADACVNAA